MGSAGQLATSPEVRTQLADVRALLAETIRNTRMLALDISPPILYELGYGPAVEWLADHLRAQYGLFVSVTVTAPAVVEEETAVVLFRATRELLINTVKHARAQSAVVSLTAVDAMLQLTVTDDGMGFDPTHPQAPPGITGGFGLVTLRERMHHLGGRLRVDSAPGHGTRITLEVPHPR